MQQSSELGQEWLLVDRTCQTALTQNTAVKMGFKEDTPHQYFFLIFMIEDGDLS